MNNSKKQNKTIKWERLEISSRKLERSRERFMQGWTQYRNGRDLTEVEGIKRWQENTEERTIKNVLVTWITIMVWSVIQSQTSWNVKSSGP